MPIGIQDRLMFQLQVNGKEVNLQQNTLDFLHIVESVRIHLPMVTLQIKDVTKFFSQNDFLVDATTMKITLGVENKKFVFNMRLFSHKELTMDGVQTYRLHGYLDVPLFWTSSRVAIIKDTASGALRTICNETGLTFQGPNTNDQQLWIPYNRKYTVFSDYIAQHSYLDQGSCMQMAISTDKVMRLVNVTDFEKFRTKQVFSNAPQQGQSLAADWRLLNSSGFLNNVSGYKDTNVSQAVFRDDSVIKDARVNKNTTKLMMNEDVRSKVGRNRVTHAPIDVGNVNENYERAAYQNARLGNLFSTGLEILTPAVVNAELMDVINCQISRPGVDGVTSLSGRYMVTSKVFYLQNNNFYQKLEVFRHGLNDKTERTQS
jgi:hypothetical protein